MTQKSQLWSLDFTVASFIIVGAFVLLFFNYFSYSQDSTNSFITESIQISESLFTTGLPTNWTNTTVKVAGIFSENNRIDNTKLTELYRLSQSELRTAFGTTQKITIILRKDGDIVPIASKNLAGYNYSFAKDIASITRYAIYDGAVHEVEVSVWE